MIKPGDMVWAISFWVKYRTPPQNRSRKTSVVWSREMAEHMMEFYGSEVEPDRFLVIGYGDKPRTLVVLSAQGATGTLEERHVTKTHSFSDSP